MSTARDELKAFRVDSTRIGILRDALKCYEGTHSYHNFTTGKHPTDANSKRYIISFTCGEPFVDLGSDSEWVLLSVVGQSFLLNQIRKMIGLATEVTNGQVPISMMKDALSKQKVRALLAGTIISRITFFLGSGLFLFIVLVASPLCCAKLQNSQQPSIVSRIQTLRV